MKKIMGILCLCSLLFVGCADKDKISMKELFQNNNETGEEKADSGFHVAEPGSFDSADTAVIVKINQDEKKITFLNRVVNKNYTLKYDGTTTIFDKYEEAMSMDQLQKGDIVDVRFVKLSKKCVSIKLSDSAWKCEEVEEFTVNQSRMQMEFFGNQYSLAPRMVISSAGETIELTDLNAQDTLTVMGIDKTVYSITVTKGHGYLRLQNAEYFVGGFIDVGQKMIQKVTEDMLLTVPEGTYQIVVRNGKNGGTKEAVIHSGEETVLDVEDLKGEEIKTGNVFFTVTPADASVYIDGEKVDLSTYVTLEYGIHQMIVKAAGYETISQYLKVGQENANLNVEMEPAGNETDEQKKSDQSQDVSENSAASVSENNITETPTTVAGNGSYYVKINAPSGVELYQDGSYMGVTPLSIPKVAGSHILSLRKTGYQTRSYTIQVDSEQKDLDLSFSDLVVKANVGEE